MKRLHVHIAVEDLQKSIGFYSTLFGAEPTKQKADYAKWMLDDPRVNFAISARGMKPGLDHFGIQADEAEELNRLREQLKSADISMLDEGETTCCYAQSDKSWVTDPGGIAWEAYQTMADVELFGKPRAASENACCAPAAKPDETVSGTAADTPQSACCG